MGVYTSAILSLCFLSISLSQIYIANLDGKNNKTRTGSTHYGLAWMNFTSGRGSVDFRIATTLTNYTSIVARYPFNATVSRSIALWSTDFPGLQYPAQSNKVNISSAQETALIANSWTIFVNTPSFPSGEISGGLSVPTVPTASTLGPIGWKTWVELTFLIVMLVLLIFDVFEPWFTVFCTVIFFMFCGILTVQQSIEGFSNSSVFTVGILFVVVEPLQRSRTMKFCARMIFGRQASTWYWQLFSLFKVCCLTAFISIFLNNTPIVSMFTPIIKNWCRQVDVAPSKFLIPMDYAVIAGGLGSAIGTSTTVLVSGMMSHYKIEPMGFWEIGYLGLPMTVITILYLIIVGHWCLPNNKGGLFRLIKEQGKKFLTDLVIIPKSKLIGKTKQEAEKMLQCDLEIIEIIRSVKLEKKIIGTSGSDKSISPREAINEDVNNTTVEPSTSVNSDINESDPPRQSEETILVEKEMNRTIHIVPVLANELICEHDRLILAGAVESVVTLHQKQEIVSWVNINTAFEVKDMLGKSTLKQEDLKALDNPIAFDGIVNSSPKNNEPIVEPKQVSLKEKLAKLSEKLNLTEKLRQQRKEIEKNEPEFFELVVSDENPFLGRQFGESNFKGRYEAAVLAVRQKTDKTKDLEELTIREGDTILVLSKKSFYEKWINEPDFYVISRLNVDEDEESHYTITVPFGKGKKYDIWWYEFMVFPIFIAMIALATAGVFDMLRAAMAAACIMILIGLLTPEEAIRAIHWKLMMLMGSSIALGMSILNSGLGTAFGELVNMMKVPTYMLPVLIFIATLLTATVVHKEGVVSIWFALTYALATTLELNPRPFAFAIAIASSCTFLTPFCYQCNVIVSGPGGYRFWHFTLVGSGLCVLYILFCGTLLPVIWPIV